MIAADVMTRDVISIAPDATVGEAVQKMLDKGISGLFVIGQDGVLRGIITEGDLLHRSELGTGRRASWWLRLFSPGREAADFTESHSRRVSDLMTTDVITVDEGAELSDIVQVLERNGIKRVAVVKDGNVTGVISRANLLRALSAIARETAKATGDDRTIKSSIERELAKQSWAPAARIDVTVLKGVVEMWGTITSEDERRAVCVIAENTPGVKRVIDHLMFMDLYSGTVIESPNDQAVKE